MWVLVILLQLYIKLILRSWIKHYTHYKHTIDTSMPKHNARSSKSAEIRLSMTILIRRHTQIKIVHWQSTYF